MKRKEMTREVVPNNSVTNGGNGAYMNKKARVPMDQTIVGRLIPNATATGKPVLALSKKPSKY